jgi:hypothetical protein
MIPLLIACSSDFSDSELPLSESGLPDLQAAMDDEGCDTLEGNAVAGAVAWYWGEYLIDGTSYDGEERLIYYANQAWRDEGGGDCEVVWQTTGVDTNPGACGTCDIGMSVSAVLDVGQSSCPDGLMADTTWSEDYGLSRSEGGTVEWFFAGSGNPFGSGYHSDDALNYLSEKTCVWFGR